MSSLAELQRWMAGALQRRGALPKDPVFCAEAAALATGSSKLSPVEQLEIYRRQFWLRHTSLLLEDFAALAALIGQASWERLVEEYLASEPPTSFELRHLGRALPDFVARSTWLPEPELAEDLARVELAYLEVFDAEDAPPLRPEDVARVPPDAWEDARLGLAPALRLLEARYPVAELRTRLRSGEPNVPRPEREPTRLAIYRGLDRELHHAVLGPTAFALLGALASGHALGMACERAISERPEAAAELESSLGGWLADWARRGFVVKLDIAV